MVKGRKIMMAIENLHVMQRRKRLQRSLQMKLLRKRKWWEEKRKQSPAKKGGRKQSPLSRSRSAQGKMRIMALKNTQEKVAENEHMRLLRKRKWWKEKRLKKQYPSSKRSE